MKRADINERLKLLGQLIAQPADTWKQVSKTVMSPRDFQRDYFFPAILIFVFAEMLGMLIDAETQVGPNWFIVLYSITIGIGLFLSFRLAVWLLSFTLKNFGYTTKPGEMHQLLGLPLIIGFVPIEVTALFQSMFILILLSLYAFYIFWVGTQTIIEIDKDKKQVFGVLAIVFSVASHALIFSIILAIKRPIIDLL